MKNTLKFTLIELLVVVAVLAVLMALLLPALDRARFMAVRASCLSDRRQNYLQISLYGNDHDYWLMAGRPDNVSHTGSQLSESNHGHLTPLGTLVKAGYVDNAEQMFCRGFDRAKPDWRPGFYVDRHYYDKTATLQTWKDNEDVPWSWIGDFFGDSIRPQRWTEMRNGNVPGDTFSGITMYMIGFWDTDGDGVITPGSSISTYREYPDKHYGDEMRLADMARHWDDSQTTPYGNVSPMVVSCADYGDMFLNGIHYSDDDWWQGKSHRREGINGAFFDGSGRWISAEERGDNDFFNTYEYDAHNAGQKWARKHLTLTPP